MLFLDNECAQVIEAALQTLQMLAEPEKNRAAMARETGMLESLSALVDGTVPANPQCVSLATNLAEQLSASTRRVRRSKRNAAASEATDENSAQTAAPNDPGSPSYYLGASSHARTHISQCPMTATLMFLAHIHLMPFATLLLSTGAGSKRARTVTLAVDGMAGRTQRKHVEEALLGVKGVIR